MSEWESPVDSEVGAKVFRMMPCGVYVVTTWDERGSHGMTASWVMQVALKPPMVAVVCDRRHRTTEMIAKTRAFAVNLLSKDQAEIGERFFTPYQRLGHTPPLADYRPGRTGAPLLTEAIATLECRVSEVVETGDHRMFVGQVVSAELRREEPVLTLADTGWHYGR